MDTGQFTGYEVTLEKPGIAWIEFNEPEKLNGMSARKKRDLIETVTQVQMDNAVRVVVFIGQGRGFCAGDNLKGYGGETEQKPLVPAISHGHDSPIGTYNGLRTISQALNLTIRRLDKLSIAAINGVAIQTGLSLALSCDFKVAASEARLGSATLRFGLLPDEGGQFLLVQHMGVARTIDFLIRKKIVSADEALELGLVNEVVPGAELRDHVRHLANELCRGPQVSMRLLKRSVYQAAELSFEQACEDIATRTGISDHHPDSAEGVASFREKREPVFNEWLKEFE
ncbi:MAG: enoyl-CoA hydratase/isomerase family protein [Proteobacteria bacterium]|jgi:2-(1,2-epoxy-1,2-dihydrophenyl)acetyl-CoA isomerase|nr:enoyl-CoA hydratase/isomerase family protein [Pseudomonadota bacterium]MDA1300461.1 enoyl-CoA hydratase/isomerase family protein [Pseudomonadota bacterium]